MKNPTLNTQTQPNFRHRSLALALIIAITSGCQVVPKAITASERQAQITADTQDMYQGQEAINGPITLEQAIARALKYNLDNRVKLMEEAVAKGVLKNANFSLLPKLTAEAGYSQRSNDYGSETQDLKTGQRIPQSSTSMDRSHTASDLTFSWNLLDFGTSYYQAKQMADQSLIVQEHRRKVVQSMTQQVRLAYWQVVGAQVLAERINTDIATAEKALNDSRTAEQERLRSPMDSLNYQRQMLDILRQLEAVRDELAQAKPRLASIMNVAPGTDFKVVMPNHLSIPELTGALDQMENQALLNRPELLEASYNERISALETRKAITRLFPGLEFNASVNHDTNSYLVNQQWNQVGLRVGWNLLNVFNINNTREHTKNQLAASHEQRLALNMAVLTQVHVAYLDYKGRKHQFERNSQMFSVDSRILTHTRNAARNSADSQLVEIRANASALMSELRYYQSYGALQGAYGQVLASMGTDLLPKEVSSTNVNRISEAVLESSQQADKSLGVSYTPVAAIVP